MAFATLPFSLPNLLAPLQALVQWLAGGPQQAPRAPAPAVRVAYPAAAAAPARPLRVLRVVDAGASRLVISGRMADVCAELDRLAAQEA